MTSTDTPSLACGASRAIIRADPIWYLTNSLPAMKQSGTSTYLCNTSDLQRRGTIVVENT